VTLWPHTRADLWTGSTWRPPNPPNPAFHLPLTIHHPRPRQPPQIPNSLPPLREPSCDDGGRGVSLSLRPAAVGEYRRASSPFPVIRALPLTTFLSPLSAFSSDDEQIGSNASSPAGSGAVDGSKVEVFRAAGLSENRYASCARPSPTPSRYGCVRLTRGYRRRGCVRLLSWKETLWSSLSTFFLTFHACICRLIVAAPNVIRLFDLMSKQLRFQYVKNGISVWTAG
jgi:hypothetical protein